MKNKWYKAYIIERFMDEKERAEFDRRYQSHKIVSFGRQVVKMPGLLDKFKKIL